MRQTPRAKQLRPTFDSLDHRIAPSSVVATPVQNPVEPAPPPFQGPQPPPGGGGSTPPPK